MNDTKQRQYSRLAEQLSQLQDNLEEATQHLDTMSKQCNTNIINQLGKLHASWLMGSDLYFQDKVTSNASTRAANDANEITTSETMDNENNGVNENSGDSK
ncbi:hypothetical protein TPHA_0G02810 [Tetrapisispora phaffii CBS 4417]|uniref:Uncharacterized protein n=1 Tax=Tetrapisispora phaffii (strain ATCC 24235 / CBS 4417 / NBRC 1672 / NRRL Y-8282 / UCD 70-5) TaxID=1071381 RepID=G8BW41_TETPH|nr:hypothetical protein TPHA_0G02810 [Tetrapisispora phaffii CBS 4417]CCE64119.1 hypothetical protein TPHA_0G02810 [Tetrapisispora phaffii CBS 4417]